METENYRNIIKLATELYTEYCEINYSDITVNLNVSKYYKIVFTCCNIQNEAETVIFLDKNRKQTFLFGQVSNYQSSQLCEPCLYDLVIHIFSHYSVAVIEPVIYH